MNLVDLWKPFFRFQIRSGGTAAVTMAGCVKKKNDKRWSVLVWVIVVALLIGGCSDRKPTVHRIGILCGADFFLPVIDGFKARMTVPVTLRAMADQIQGTNALCPSSPKNR